MGEAIPDWVARPGSYLEVGVYGRGLRPFRAIERLYAAALDALASDDIEFAAGALADVVAQDTAERYPTARLLLCIVATERGDEATARPLARLVYPDRLDSFASKRVTHSWLHVFTEDAQERPPLVQPEALLSPAVTVHLAAGAYLIGAGRKDDAADAFEEAFDAGGPEGLANELCALYDDLDDYDAMLDLVEEAEWREQKRWKAVALGGNGLTDAALIVWDEAIKEEEVEPWGNGGARYLKAALMLKIGDVGGARRELARLFARFPRFEDRMALNEKASVASTSANAARKAIPEAVRHAVWRRDEGKCAQCGSHENLEFDHIIPWSRGGADTERNLQLLCGDCNRQKSATI